MVVSAVPVIAGGLYEGFKALYRVGADVNQFMNSHIEELKASETSSVARTGAILESAKVGFGIGYVTPAVVIVTGQLMMGNPLPAIGMGVVALLPTNPIALTCAAFGAVLWGWGALSKKEQEALLETVSEGLSIGIEFIRSVIRFVISKAKSLISEENREALRAQVAAAREQIKAMLRSVVDTVGEQASGAVDSASESMSAASEAVAVYWKKLKAAIVEPKKPDIPQTM
jgi:hypothetical protein